MPPSPSPSGAAAPPHHSALIVSTPKERAKAISVSPLSLPGEPIFPMEALKLSISIGAAVVLGAILLLIVLRNRLGVLNTASWLVILGAVVILPEHPQFAV